jgi:hypothetical protein
MLHMGQYLIFSLLTILLTFIFFPLVNHLGHAELWGSVKGNTAYLITQHSYVHSLIQLSCAHSLLLYNTAQCCGTAHIL